MTNYFYSPPCEKEVGSWKYRPQISSMVKGIGDRLENGDKGIWHRVREVRKLEIHGLGRYLKEELLLGSESHSYKFSHDIYHK